MEKKNTAFFALFLICLSIVIFSGCKSTEHADTANVVQGDSYSAGQLEATIQALDGTTTDSRKRIEQLIDTSRDIEDTAERIDYLFTGYEQEVQRLLDEVDTIRKRAEERQRAADSGIHSGGAVHCGPDSYTDTSGEGSEASGIGEHTALGGSNGIG